ncbi:MAG: alanine racemase [Clostridiales bacterium]|nr:alanine racemase [Clostridiales bacterium]
MQKTLSFVNLRAIRHNAMKVRSILKDKFFYAVVKADAYGHGMEETARYIEDVVDGFCVAIVDEGIALRVAGITKPVLVFAPPLDSSDVDRANFYSLTLTVNSVQTARLIGNSKCHIKVNTGMNRLGVPISDLHGVLDILDADQIEGVYSHMYAPHDAASSIKQFSLFERAVELVRAKRRNVCAHFSASGGILRGGKYLKYGVRCGILLYGYAPQGFKRTGFVSALSVYAKRMQTTRFIGGGVGYSPADRNYKTLTTFRLGYADGFFRNVPLGEKNLCMDAYIREDGGELTCVMNNADEYARRCGTISYEVLTKITQRSERVYIR